jgi:hypothetical protein
MSPPLPAAIATLYSTFARYRADDLSCCDFPDDLPLNLHLRSTPLDRLGPSDLHRYAWKAMTTWGTTDNFKHFLPRLFEILAQDGPIYQDDPEVLLGKLAYAHWQTWPAAERAAVEDFLWSLWRHLRQTYPYDLSADSFLCGLGACVNDLTPWLTEWEHDTTLPSAMHLADLVATNVDHALNKKYFRPGPANPFWQNAPSRAPQVWEWLTAPQRLAQLEAAFFAHAAADPEGHISAAVDSLTKVRTILDVLSGP